VMMGQASLEVFCVHLLCVFLALILLGGRPIFSGWQAAVIVVISVSALLVTGQVIASRRARKRERLAPPIQAVSPSGYEKVPAPEKAA
jgi:hypothetical protein